MNYIRSLDSVRAIAILLVLAWHWLPPTALINRWDIGSFGVNIFFVLSGFLITRILLSSRCNGRGKYKNILHFYIRRVLRIFPIYYLTIIFIYLFHDHLYASLEKDEFLYASTYTINFYNFSQSTWGDLTFHFWSLAVEEQFYLIWPFIIILLPERFLLPVITTCILISVFFQVRINDIEFGYLPTYTCFDAFGMGAILSWVVTYRPEVLGKYLHTMIVASVFACLLLAIQQYSEYLHHLPIRTMHSTIAVTLIGYLLLMEERKTGMFKWFWNNKFLVFIGRISYGMYMYHVLVQWIAIALKLTIQKRIGYIFFLEIPALFYIVEFTILIGISYVSWKWIEEPVNSLKMYFPR